MAGQPIMSHHAVQLYKIVLRLHRGLPMELRILGDEYVREEFKRHKGVKHDEAQIFLKEWMDYALQLSQQLGLRGPQMAKKIGTPLTENQLDLFQSDQLGQLYELQQEASRIYKKDENIKKTS